MKSEMKLVCVLAVHNEEDYLPYSLPSIRELDSQVVVVLDRCVDSSEKIIRRHIKNTHFVLKQSSCWKDSCSEAKSLGCNVARELGANLILITDADVLLDVNAVQKAQTILSSSDCQLVVLPYWQYSLYGSFLSKLANKIQNLFARINRKMKIHPVRFGIYVGKADILYLDDTPSQFSFLQEKVRTRWIHTKSLHLRPRLDIASQIQHGRARARLPQYSWLKVILFSIFTFQPFTLVGYLKGKMGKPL